MSRIMRHHIKPVAAKTGIEIKGWHTLRPNTTLLRQNNNNPKVVEGLLRHASYSITMNVCDEAMSEEKRNAHRSGRPVAACLVLNHDECLRRSYVGREAQRPSRSDPAA
jgi:hypothetical protein